MKLVKLECPNCKAKFDVNEDMKKFTCNFCGTTTLLDDEVTRVKYYSSKLDSIINEIEEYYDNGNYKKCIDIAKKYLDEYPTNAKIKKIKYNSIKKVIKEYYSDEDYEKCINMINEYLDDFSSDKEMLKLFNEVSKIVKKQEEIDDSNLRLTGAIFWFVIFGFLFMCILIVTINTYNQYHNFTKDEANFFFPQLIIYGIPMFWSLKVIISHKKD